MRLLGNSRDIYSAKASAERVLVTIDRSSARAQRLAARAKETGEETVLPAVTPSKKTVTRRRRKKKVKKQTKIKAMPRKKIVKMLAKAIQREGAPLGSSQENLKAVTKKQLTEASRFFALPKGLWFTKKELQELGIHVVSQPEQVNSFHDMKDIGNSFHLYEMDKCRTGNQLSYDLRHELQVARPLQSLSSPRASHQVDVVPP